MDREIEEAVIKNKTASITFSHNGSPQKNNKHLNRLVDDCV